MARLQVIVPQSDGWVRAFDPETGKKLWEFDINAKTSVLLVLVRFDRNSFWQTRWCMKDHVYIGFGA